MQAVLLLSVFFDNPELPEQVCRFCESIPEYVQAREEYHALAQELEETMGRQWYFTFEDRLNQYCGLGEPGVLSVRPEPPAGDPGGAAGGEV